MEYTQIILWMIGSGFGITFGLLLVIWNHISNLESKLSAKISEVDSKLSDVDSKLSAKIFEVDRRLSEVDKRLYGIETVLHMKDCCVLKQDQYLKKAE
jgi:hypothetical protein